MEEERAPMTRPELIAETDRRIAVLETRMETYEAELDELAALKAMKAAAYGPDAPKPRKPRSDKGVVKKKRAPVGSPEVLTEPGAEEVARKPGTFQG